MLGLGSIHSMGYNPGTQEVESKGSEVQAHLQAFSGFKASRRFMKPGLEK